MALYDYKCNKCKIDFQLTSSFSMLETNPPKCPVCHTEDVQRIYKNINVIFKGKGFYSTDNKNP